MTLPREPVVVQRTGDSLAGLIDQHEQRIYFTPGSDVRRDDVLAFRGFVRRVDVEPEVWLTGGVVVTYEDAPPVLPDLGGLFRNTSTKPVLDEDTGVLTFPNDAPIWTGPCSAEPTESMGLEPELGGQRVAVVPMMLTVPLSLVDVKAGDQFRVSQSRDARLTTRILTITAVRASSSSLVRQLVAFDNQGG